MNKVEMLFVEKGINRFGIILYSKEDSLNFVKQCKNFKIGILGIDGFIIKESTTRPSLENSIDFSSMKSKEEIYEMAERFIGEREEGLYFEIVCD